MKNTTQLPSEYTKFCDINLQKNKKIAIIINVLALLIAAVMIVIASFFVPINHMFDFSGGMKMYFIKWGILLIAVFLYMVLHELVHGICMKHFTGAPVKYGFTGLYAFAGSNAYFNKKSYIIVALAPIVVLGIALLILNFFVPIGWFWVVYFIQICNISGAAGDLYVTCKFSKFPSDILVQDSGVSMSVFTAKQPA